MSRKKTKKKVGKGNGDFSRGYSWNTQKKLSKTKLHESGIKISLDKMQKGMVTTKKSFSVLKDQTDITSTNIRDVKDRTRRQDMQKTDSPGEETLMNGEEIIRRERGDKRKPP